MSLIATVLERRVWIDRGFYNLYPNLYIVLVAESALARKSTAIVDIAFALLKSCPRLVEEVNFASDKLTAQALISELRDQYKKSGVSAAYLVADELAMLLRADAIGGELINVLTRSYSCAETCDYHTISRGKEICRNVCINFLGGTTPEWIKDSFPKYAIAGGFAGRIVFVPDPGVYKKIPDPFLPKKEWEVLKRDLTTMRDLEGEVKLSGEARQWYNSWYVDVYNPDDGNEMIRGYQGRRHDTLLKLAMILNFSRRELPVIEEEDLINGLRLLTANERKLSGIMEKIEATQSGEDTNKVVRGIKRGMDRGNGWMAHSDLLRHVSYFLTARGLADLMEGMVGSGVVEKKMEGSKVWVRVKKDD